MTRNRSLTALALVMLVVGLLFWRSSADPQLAKVRTMQQDLIAEAMQGKITLESGKKWLEFRQEAEKLRPEDRQAIGEVFQKQMFKQMQAYLKMTPEEKTKHLDEQIDRFETIRQVFQATSALGKLAGGKSRPAAGNATADGAASQQSQAAAPNPPGGRARTPEEREKRRKQFLDRTTPEERAAIDIYFRDITARRRARGLPDWGPPGGRRFALSKLG